MNSILLNSNSILNEDAIPLDDDRGRILFGNARSERIVGTPSDDIILSERGNDTLIGLAGNDRLIGLAGGDDLFGGSGNDFINGGTGNDDLTQSGRIKSYVRFVSRLAKGKNKYSPRSGMLEHCKGAIA
jgi:Ca2+-binding RTX toxin-like protein